MNEIPRFSDFAEEETALSGEKLKIEDVIGKEIIITGYRITKSKYQKRDAEECLKLQFTINSTTYVLFTGSNVLIEQIKKYQDHIPFYTIIQSIDKFFTFS